MSLVFLFVAFKIQLFLKPWKVLRKILLRQFLLWMLKYLRYAHILKIREFGYSWYKLSSIKLYEYQTEESDELDYNATKRRLWLEGLEWKLDCSRSLTDSGEDAKSSEAEQTGRSRTTKAWCFEDVSTYILKGPEADDTDKEPKTLQFYNELAQYGELLWRQWPESGFSDEHRRYETLLYEVYWNDPEWFKRDVAYSDLVISTW